MSVPSRISRSAAATVRAFLEPSHLEAATRLSEFADRELRGRAEPANDDGARVEAREVARELGAAGMFAPIVAQDMRAFCLTRETLAGVSPLADAVVALQALSAMPLLLGGNEVQRDRWLARLMNGTAVGAFAMTEPEAGSDVAAIRTCARRSGDDWILDGEKHLISNAGIADVYIMFAVTTPGAGSRGISAFAVAADTPGLRFAEAQIMAAPHPLGRLVLEHCHVAGDALLGNVDGGFRLGMASLDRLRPSVGAAACGMAARAIDEAVAHASSRQQFGHPLSGFQLVREKVGRMATALEAARLLVYRAAWERDTGTERISVQAAMAKSFATEAAQSIVDEAVQIVGGRGVLVGHPVERLYRAIRALRIYEGATDVLRLIVAAAVFGDDRAKGAAG